ncbi:23S rRNA (pseudouridine(1915)-N(3))-methyltransferase RlmH [Tumebacillus permanentifrigoris]|uniref:Ribosomal RNA large subunit methyltransferase H n=1 Tax=Tumebacillus permanentifrigoris TaxID=378543 RepID=A0A316DE77_9BACL|nr:23S rRNA (pseudouridine(1915)-N(3))-methyltransferase RlmH [Tumebacillus permanentifrigoris]PWK16527.1 23S rRNA (pseudouridine1915-N3)-methyltransferase [Tumebacillus permanentifrigoris]
MQINLLTVGKLKEKYWVGAVEEYKKRLSSYAKVSVVEVPDEPTPDNASAAQEEQIKRKEAEKLLAKVGERDYVIALAIEGKSITSEEFAEQIDRMAGQGYSTFTFVIGGSLGLHETVLQRANYKLSFSKFTFPHQMVRAILLEQVYRAFRILRGEPYHK